MYMYIIRVGRSRKYISQNDFGVCLFEIMEFLPV